MEPEPTPPPQRRAPRGGGIVFGLLLLAIGVYFLLDQTLGLDLPPIGRLWPLALVGLGSWIVYEQLALRR